MNVIPFSFLSTPIVLTPSPPGPAPTNAYDAGNVASYPGSGTSWNNIGTGGTKNAKLFNGVGYSALDGGSLTFNGSNQYATASYDSTFDFSTGNYTMNAWVNLAAFGGNVTSKDTYGLNFDWCMYIPNSSTLIDYSAGTSRNVTKGLSPSLSTNTWYQLTIASSGNSVTMFRNGVQQQTAGSMVTTNASQVGITIGCFSYSNPNTFLNGKIAIVEYYNVGLTPTNVLDKFNFYKTRFGY